MNYFEQKTNIYSQNLKFAKYKIEVIFYMSTATYLMHILYAQVSGMNNDLILVIIPVLSITVLMFGLRSIFVDTNKQKLKKQS